jgi:serine/threonine protein kinase
VAPEQIIVAANAIPASDVYSLGCTLFKLLAGRGPFEDERHREFRDKLRAHSLQSPPALSALRPDTPPKLVALVGRLLAKRAAERGSAAELADALAPFASGHKLPKLLETGLTTLHDIDVTHPRPEEAVEPRPKPTGPRPPQRPPRKPNRIALMGLVLFVILLIAAIILFAP